ncbi:hypothetical protein VPHK436_0009 [Vibrio phage K436]
MSQGSALTLNGSCLVPKFKDKQLQQATVTIYLTIVA